MANSVIPSPKSYQIIQGTATLPEFSSLQGNDVTFALNSAFASDVNTALIFPLIYGSTTIFPITVKSVSGNTASVRMFNIANSTIPAGVNSTIQLIGFKY